NDPDVPPSHECRHPRCYCPISRQPHFIQHLHGRFAMSKSTLFSLTDVPRPAATAQAARPHGAIEADRPLSTVWNGRSLQADPSRSERFEDRSIAAGTRLAGIGYRFLLAVASTLAGLGIGFHFADNAAEPGQAEQQVASAEIDPIPQTLPTVHVSAQVSVPVLPTVLVRAS